MLKPEVGRNRIHWKLEDPVVLQSPPSRDDVIKTLDIADPQTLGPELYQKVLFMGISRLKVEGDDKLAEVWVEKLGEFRNRA